MATLFYIVGATFVISLISLLGAILISRDGKFLNKITFLLVGLSTGTLLGSAFLHLIPESLEFLGIETVSLVMLLSFATFFLIEKLLHWHHCHDGECDIHQFGYVNLLGDAFHNFIDGLIIAASFSVSIELGIISSTAIILHEIPQELGDFGVLIHAGIKKQTAIFYNFLVALMAVGGGGLGYFFLSSSDMLLGYLLPVAAGGFLYISASDLIPEIRNETNLAKSLKAFALFLVGIALMYFLRHGK